MKNIIVIADLHIGSAVGVWPPSNLIEDGSEISQNAFQKWLFRQYSDMLTFVEALSPPVTLVIAGDLIQGKSVRDGELSTNRVDVQRHVAKRVLEPLRERVAKCYVLHGTPYHEGKGGEDVADIADWLGAERDPKSGSQVWYELFLKTDTGTIHFAHHVGVTSRKAYSATAPLAELLELRSDLLSSVKSSPNIVGIVRAHRHKYVSIELGTDLFAVTCPCWQLKTEYAYRRAIPGMPDVGFLHIGCSEEGIELHRHLYRLPSPHVEVL